MQWTFELELRADFPRDDPAPYNPLCVTDLFLLQYCPALYESLFFVFPLTALEELWKGSSESYSVEISSPGHFPLATSDRQAKKVGVCCRLCSVVSRGIVFSGHLRSPGQPLFITETRNTQ